MRTFGQPSGQLFPKRWSLSNPNRTKSIMNKHKVKHHRNSDSKTGNRDHIRTSALELSVMNNWGFKLVLRRQPERFWPYTIMCAGNHRTFWPICNIVLLLAVKTTILR